MSSEWILPFSAGVGATVVGFILTMIWDFFKYRREIQKREQALINLIQYELNENINILDSNQTLLKMELNGLTRGCREGGQGGNR